MSSLPASRTPGRRSTGDAGWAGVLAESFLADPQRPAFLIFEPGMELLPFFVEALALLPAESRWDVDFSTYFTKLPQGLNCAWRGVLAGSPEAKRATERARRFGARPERRDGRRQRGKPGRVREDRQTARTRHRAFRLGPRADLVAQGKPGRGEHRAVVRSCWPKTGSPDMQYDVIPGLQSGTGHHG